MAQLKDKIIATFDLDRDNVDKLIAQVEALIHEGNVRQAIVKDASGATVFKAPLTLGVVGVALAPFWAAIGAIAALAADFTIQIEGGTDPRSGAELSETSIGGEATWQR